MSLRQFINASEHLSGLLPVKMFRAVQDPMIGPKPRNAFMLPDLPGWEAMFHVESGTIYVKTDKDRIHCIGTGNWSAIEFYPAEAMPKEWTQDKAMKPQTKGAKVINGAI